MASIQIGIGEYAVITPGDTISTLGLGSCCGVVLYDPQTHISGMIHVMLPNYHDYTGNLNIARFADTGIPMLIAALKKKGAGDKLSAKMAGGAQMFAGQVHNERMMVGTNNVASCRHVLQQYKIPILAQDVLGTMGRSITFYPDTMMMLVRMIGFGEKYI